MPDNRFDIRSAAQAILSKWLKTQENRETAHTVLCDALIKVHMRIYTEEVLKST